MNPILMSQSCTPHSFTYPSLLGAEFTALTANLVTNYSASIPPGSYYSHNTSSVSNLNFCNVSIHYTHPGWNDDINVQVWLPVDIWNDRLQASGGGGMQTGLVYTAMYGAVADGYATVSTDGGHALSGFEIASWAQASPGNINWFLLHDMAEVAWKDATVIGKAITKDFYGRGPNKSYFNGCSMGGRQGLLMAQRYPDAYDGILSAAPAINFAKFIIADYWPQMVMNIAGEYPAPCEFEAIRSAAIEACDGLDGVTDGIISSPDLCHFDATDLIGQNIHCKSTGRNTTISRLATDVANTAWRGARTPNDEFLWYGLSHEAPLTPITNVSCNEQGCKLNIFTLPSEWIRLYIDKNPSVDPTTLTHDDLVQVFWASHREYQSIMSVDDADLRAFGHHGGKMITWHGLADQYIFPNGTRAYYEAVAAVDPDVAGYYSYFEAPGVEHCWGGIGAYPGSALEELVRWVEEGVAPDVLPGRGLPNGQGRTVERNLCAYPQTARYRGSGDVRASESFECV